MRGEPSLAPTRLIRERALWSLKKRVPLKSFRSMSRLIQVCAGQSEPRRARQSECCSGSAPVIPKAGDGFGNGRQTYRRAFPEAASQAAPNRGQRSQPCPRLPATRPYQAQNSLHFQAVAWCCRENRLRLPQEKSSSRTVFPSRYKLDEIVSPPGKLNNHAVIENYVQV